SWLWNFGDGTTDTVQNPIHTYNIPGIYTVSLSNKLSGGCAQSINEFRVFKLEGGIADFTVNHTQCPPYCATFTDSSTNAVGWFWDFGDGTTSTAENPQHTYTSPGNYQVTLTITVGPCTLSYSPPPFTAGSGDSLFFNPAVPTPIQKQQGCAPFFVTFNNYDP